MKPSHALISPAVTAMLALAAVLSSNADDAAKPALRAMPVRPHEIKLDGRLDEPAWQRAPLAVLEVPEAARSKGKTLEEPGSVRLLHDDGFLYIAFDMTDSDLVAAGTKDDEEHYTLGDLAEVFLKPAGQTWYWELHATPTGKISTYWYAGFGRLGLKAPSAHLKPRFIKVAANLRGTLNRWQDRDEGWSVEIAVPLAKLDRFGDLNNLNEGWTILCSRYNYTRYRTQAPGPELSSVPILPEPSFHLVNDYTRLIFATR